MLLRTLIVIAAILFGSGAQTHPTQASDSGAPGGFDPGELDGFPDDGVPIGGERTARQEEPAPEPKDERNFKERMQDPVEREKYQREQIERNAREQAERDANKDLIDHIYDGINHGIGTMRPDDPAPGRISPNRDTGSAGGTRG